LAIVRRLVEQHGGTVRAHSAGLSRGSRFVVRLPALPAGADMPERESASEAEPAEVDRSRASRRILVVDDHPDAGHSTAALLALEGHDVRLVHDGPSALTVVRDFHPDAVLLDIGMPGMDGYEVCRRLRRMAGQQHTLVVAISGYGQLDDVERARDAGIDHHLTKPADPRQLAEYLRKGR
jgi:two-component system CheB/CheR fusion protein